MNNMDILLTNWALRLSSGKININCGDLRRIGKTTFLKKYIVENYPIRDYSDISRLTSWPQMNEHLSIPVIMCDNLEIVSVCYDDLVKAGHLYKGIAANLLALETLKGFPHIEIISDEVPNAEELLKNFPGFKYMGGFYNAR